MGIGWISLHRQIQSHWLWEDKPFSKGQAWIDLLLLANHKDGRFLLGGSLIDARRGEVITSEIRLKERWGWSKSKVRLFLHTLKNDSMIEIKTNHKKTTINVVNYGTWQDNQTSKEPVKDQKKTSKEPVKDTINNVNNVNNDNMNMYSRSKLKNNKSQKALKTNINEFNAFWQSYPKKKGKREAEKAWSKINPDKNLYEKILIVISKAKQTHDWKDENGKFIPYPATWLNQARWEDEYEEVQTNGSDWGINNAKKEQSGKVIKHDVLAGFKRT